MANFDGNIIIGTSVDVGGIGSGLKKIEKSFSRLNKTLGLALGVASVVQLGKAALDAASNLQEVQNVVDVSFTKLDDAGNIIVDLTDKIENFSSTCIEMYGMSEYTAKYTAGSFMAMGKSLGLTMDEASNVAIKLTGLTGDFSSFYNISQEYAKVALSAVYTGETETLKRYGIVLTEANLQQYALSEGITANVKNMDARSKALLRYKYILKATQDMEGDFQRTQGSWANQVRLVQQRWQEFLLVMGNGLITVLTPAVKMLNTLIATLTRLAKILWIILGNIFGMKLLNAEEATGGIADNTENAASGMEDLTDATTAAGKAAKKSLQSFDELNNLTTPKASDSSGGASGVIDVSFDIDDASLKKEIDELMSNIDNWFDFGKAIGDAIANSLANIPWDKIYTKARNFGKHLAEFLNGFISTDTFKLVGSTIASALNTVIYSALEFATTFDWATFGLKLAEGINEFFKTFDFEAFAKTINTWIGGLATTISTLINNIDWDLVLSKIGSFFKTLNVRTVASLLGFTILKKLITSGLYTAIITGLYNGVKKLSVSTITSLGEYLNSILQSALTLDFPAIATNIARGFMNLKTSLVGNLTNFVKVLLETLSRFEYYMSMTGGNISASLEYMFGAETVGLITTFAGALLTVVGGILYLYNFVKMLLTEFSWLNEVLMVVGIALAVIGAIILGAEAWPAVIVGAVIAAISTIVILIKDNWDVIVETFMLGVEFIKSLINLVLVYLQNVLVHIKAVVYPIIEWLLNTVIQPIISIISALVKNVLIIFNGCWILIKAMVIILANWFNTHLITPIILYFKNLKESIIQTIRDTWDTIQKIWDMVVTWFTERVINPLLLKFENYKIMLIDIFTKLWEGIKERWSGVFSWFLVNLIIPLIKTFTSNLKIITTLFKAVWNDIQLVWGVASTWFTEKFINPLVSKIHYAINIIKTLFNNLWPSLLNGLKSSVNSMLGIVESLINGMIKAINKFFSGFNTLVEGAAAITGDDWEGVGIIPEIKIPRLAKGGVIPPNNEFLAVLGDQKHGTNIEAPLDTIKQAMLETLSSISFSDTTSPIIVEIDGKEVFRAVRNQSRIYTKSTGQPAF